MLSRGPRTNEGKAKSSQNALKHGLPARHALLAGEDPVEYRRLRQGLVAEFSPQSALESELVERVASMLWRLRRIARYEVALMASIENDTPSVDILTGLGGPAKTRLGRYVQEFLEMDFSGKLMNTKPTCSGSFLQFSTNCVTCTNIAAARPKIEMPRLRMREPHQTNSPPLIEAEKLSKQPEPPQRPYHPRSGESLGVRISGAGARKDEAPRAMVAHRLQECQGARTLFR